MINVPALRSALVYHQSFLWHAVSWLLQGALRSVHYRLPWALRLLCVLQQRELLEMRTVGRAVETSIRYPLSSVDATIAIKKV